MNESLRHALVRARLTEGDVAARLEVDPKTVRRWLEGRVPYLRHRWAIANMLGMDETDLWPQLSTARSMPAEVRAVYPHGDDVPRESWQSLFRSAERDIGILAYSRLCLTNDSGTLAMLAERARLGVKVRICVRDPDMPQIAGEGTAPDARNVVTSCVHNTLARYKPLQQCGVDIRLHRMGMKILICRADDQLLVVQHAFGIPCGRAPVLHLSGAEDGDMFTSYLETFERIWTASAPMQ